MRRTTLFAVALAASLPPAYAARAQPAQPQPVQRPPASGSETPSPVPPPTTLGDGAPRRDAPAIATTRTDPAATEGVRVPTGSGPNPPGDNR